MKIATASPRRRIIIAIIGLLIIIASAAYYLLQKLPNQPQPEAAKQPAQQTLPQEETPPNKSLRLSMMGDMLAHDSVVAQAKTADGYDFTPYFASVRQLYQSSDVVFCNQEVPSAGASYGISGYPTFNAPVEFARDLSRSGCNVINLANNHMADKGQAAINATLDEWQKLSPLAVAGANRSEDEQNTVRYFDKNGLKVAFVAFADFSNAALPASYSVNLYHNEPLVRRLLTEARQKADVVLVSAHWGTEDSHDVNANQRQTAALFNELGADLVIGTGPHVLQSVDNLTRADGHKTLVFYPIGNFLSSQLGVDQLTGGVAHVTLTKTKNGVALSDVSFDATFMS